MLLPRLPTRGRVLEFWHTHVRRSPWQFRDRYGITYQFRPGDSFAEHYDKRATLDDPAQLAYLERTVEPTMTVLDVGANIGGASLLAARLMGNRGRLFAFEADPDTYTALRANFALNQLPYTFEALHCAVTRSCGVVTLHRFPRFAASWNSISRYDAHGLTPVSTTEVDSIDLDTFVRERKLGVIDLLKVDVEGAEPEVFEGAKNALKNRVVRRVLFEISRVPLLGSGHEVGDVLEPLRAAGYAFYALNPDGRLRAVTPREISAVTFGNFVALAEV
jgi:FkbM family methyltransferase